MAQGTTSETRGIVYEDLRPLTTKSENRGRGPGYSGGSSWVSQRKPARFGNRSRNLFQRPVHSDNTARPLGSNFFYPVYALSFKEFPGISRDLCELCALGAPGKNLGTLRNAWVPLDRGKPGKSENRGRDPGYSGGSSWVSKKTCQVWQPF